MKRFKELLEFLCEAVLLLLLLFILIAIFALFADPDNTSELSRLLKETQP